MVRDVAVHDPCARVVCLEGDDDVSICGQQHDVPAHGVVAFGSQAGRKGEGGGLEDGEVVAVEVDLWRRGKGCKVSVLGARREREGRERGGTGCAFEGLPPPPLRTSQT